MPIEQKSDGLQHILSVDQEINILGNGYLAAEGPLWYEEEGYLLFSDIIANRRMRWAPGEGVTLFHEPTNNSNGLTLTKDGRLVACEHGSRRVTLFENDGSTTIVADSYLDKRLNCPNDVVVKSDGSIYFTDPIGPASNPDLDFSGVYRVSEDLSTLTLLVDDFLLPNGLAFSPDESLLYIDDSDKKLIKVFDVKDDGTIANPRVFCEMQSELPGLPDGMKFDVEGNLYCTGPGGVWVIDPNGKHLGTILLDAEQATNCAWGGESWKTLFITTREFVASIEVKIPGVPVRR